MSAYAALVSLMNTLQQIQNHSRLLASLDKKQIQSLRKKVDFLLNFVESYSCHGGISKEAEDLESQIASAAHAAEDVIESHIVDQILAGFTDDHGETSSSFLLDLEKRINDMWKKSGVKIRLRGVMKDMKSIEKEIMKVEKKGRFEDQQLIRCSTPAASTRPLTTGKTTMVGFDDYLLQLKDILAGAQSKRQVIPIAGMGGIGKTTLARNAFEDSLIMQHFDVRAWVTISQNYTVRGILLELVPSQENIESLIDLDPHKLGEMLYKHLCGRRYLIILDDIWSIEAWENIKFFFPDNNNGSRVVVTTRLTDVATYFGSSYIAINFLDEDNSWNLFCERAFGQESCPLELEEAGKKIVRNCRGLPLSIVVIGGFLRNSCKSQEYWENVAKDTNSILNSEGDQQCLSILSLSYSHLPAHLKPCFLYMGVFPEDDEIRASRLIKFWVAEGFLKPNKDQSLEETAEAYLKDLIHRNLILVCRWGSNGKIKACNVHDLVRELCLRIAKKEKFFCVMKLLDAPRASDGVRRIVIQESIPKESHSKVFQASESIALARSLVCKGSLPFNFRLLRVVNAANDEWYSGRFLEADFQNVNLRCLDRRFVRNLGARITSSLCLRSLYLPRKISLFWNLQTINIKGCMARIVAPSEIWEMPELRHVKVDILDLPDPPPSDRVDLALQNLQSLGRAENFRLSEEVCKRIPNIKTLYTVYSDFPEERAPCSYYCPHNLSRFHKLESLNFYFSMEPCWRDLLLNFTFPSSLRKLSLYRSNLHWEDLSEIGSLPYLEVLKLECDSVYGSTWNPIEGEFLCLKFLKISACRGLIYWIADRCHFPVLQNLVLEYVGLVGIPSGIGEIPTLKCIRLNNCRLSCAISAMEILVEQESQGIEGLHLEVLFHAVNAKNLERFREKIEQEGFRSSNIKFGFSS